VLDIDNIGVTRERICDALRAEGVAIGAGYVNVHQLPMYQQKIAYGSKGFPWNSDICKREVSYHKGICPVAEELHDKTFIVMPMCLFELSNEDVQLIISAFQKVWRHLEALK
jgi:dTDP-4-amino-4,6-dideoxygalactose transaminase